MMTGTAAAYLMTDKFVCNSPMLSILLKYRRVLKNMMVSMTFVSVAAFAIGVLIPAYAETIPSPHMQWGNGVIFEQIRCVADKILLDLNGRPACLSSDSAKELSMRGYSHADPVDFEGYPGESCGGSDDVFYKILRNVSHNITDDDFISLCIQPEHLWYAIHLDTRKPGSITLEIPKNEIDLRQFDYLDCKPSHFYDGPKFTHITAEQISESAYSRVIKFTYDEPVSRIAYHDKVGKFIQPNSCIERYEQEGHEPKTHLPWKNTIEQHTDESRSLLEHLDLISGWGCNNTLVLDYMITGGKVDYICNLTIKEGLDNGTVIMRGYSLSILLSEVNSLEYLTVNIPWMDWAPRRILDLWTFPYEFRGAVRNLDPDNCIASEIIKRNPKYQTFHMPINKGSSHIQIYILDHSSGVDLLPEIMDSIAPNNITDDRWPSFDKNVDGMYLGIC